MTTLNVTATRTGSGHRWLFAVDSDVTIEVTRAKKTCEAVLRIEGPDGWFQADPVSGWTPRVAVDSLLELIERKVVEPEPLFEWCTEDLLIRLQEVLDEMQRALPVR